MIHVSHLHVCIHLAPQFSRKSVLEIYGKPVEEYATDIPSNSY